MKPEEIVQKAVVQHLRARGVPGLAKPKSGHGPSKGFRGTLAERFDEKTIPEPNSGCLLWLGGCRKAGYGLLWDGNKLVSATHIALLLSGRPVPAGKFALHHCDNPHCVNADHLFIGDAKANVADCISKGRHDFSGLPSGYGARWR